MIPKLQSEHVTAPLVQKILQEDPSGPGFPILHSEWNGVSVAFRRIRPEGLVCEWSIAGAAEECCVRAKLLKGLVGAWGFEPQTPTVSMLYRGPTRLESTSTKFPKKNSHCIRCIHCFNCSFCTFLCAKLCATFYNMYRLIEEENSLPGIMLFNCSSFYI